MITYERVRIDDFEFQCLDVRLLSDIYNAINKNYRIYDLFFNSRKDMANARNKLIDHICKRAKVRDGIEESYCRTICSELITIDTIESVDMYFVVSQTSDYKSFIRKWRRVERRW